MLERKGIESRLAEWTKEREALLKKIAEGQRAILIMQQQKLQFDGAILAAQEVLKDGAEVAKAEPSPASPTVDMQQVSVEPK